MRAVVQRVTNAHVQVDGNIIGQIENGLVVLLGVTHEDEVRDVEAMVKKLVHLRIFEDEDQKMNLSLKDIGGSVLSISQFTLYSDIRKGRRPSFIQAARPEHAENLYETFNQLLRDEGVPVETGKFGAMMDVRLTNEGPVTIIMETKQGIIVDPS